MKYILFAVFAAVLLTACSTKKQEKKEGAVELKKEAPQGAKFLTKKEFLEKVWDFETNPDTWTYIGDKPCVIDFYADWCGPCKKIAPFMDELSVEYKNDIYVYKINVEKEPALGKAFKVESLPSFVFCPMDGDYQMIVGIKEMEQTQQKFKWVINQFLLGQ